MLLHRELLCLRCCFRIIIFWFWSSLTKHCCWPAFLSFFIIVCFWRKFVYVHIIVEHLLLGACAFPVNNSRFAKHSHIPYFNRIFLSVASCNHRIAIISKCNRVTTYVRSPKDVNWSSIPNVVNLDCVVPTPTYNHVLVYIVKFCAKDAI